MTNGRRPDLDAGLVEALCRQADLDPAWVDDPVPIKQVAEEQGLERMVLDLHGRWPAGTCPWGPT